MNKNEIEKTAKELVEKELNLQVIIHDDNSEPSMYDLRIGSVDAPKYAIECVGAVCQKTTETINIAYEKKPVDYSSSDIKISGDWNVTIEKTARVKLIKSEIARILMEFENLGITGFTPVDWQLKQSNLELFNTLSRLGVVYLNKLKETGNGDIYLSCKGILGSVDGSGEGLAHWVENFLMEDSQADVIQKLKNSNATERHVFIPIVFNGAPKNVEYYFIQDEMPIPELTPNLPKPITGVWLLGGDGKGIKYTNGKWSLFGRNNI